MAPDGAPRCTDCDWFKGGILVLVLVHLLGFGADGHYGDWFKARPAIMLK